MSDVSFFFKACSLNFDAKPFPFSLRLYLYSKAKAGFEKQSSWLCSFLPYFQAFLPFSLILKKCIQYFMDLHITRQQRRWFDMTYFCPSCSAYTVVDRVTNIVLYVRCFWLNVIDLSKAELLCVRSNDFSVISPKLLG